MLFGLLIHSFSTAQVVAREIKVSRFENLAPSAIRFPLGSYAPFSMNVLITFSV
jgi:hypothetical protein